MRKAITLVELIISMTLFGVIILGAVAFSLSSEKFLSSSENSTEVLNDLTFILQHVHKSFLVATGDINNQGVAFLVNTVTIRQDLNLNGNSLNTPGNYSDDRTVAYRFAGGQVTFDVSKGGVSNPTVVLTNFFIDLGAPNAFGLSLNVLDGGLAISNLTLRLDPTNPVVDPRTNPQVSTIDGAGGRTVYFYSFSHSWQ